MIKLIMPANLPPNFFTLQEKLKNAKDIQEKIKILEEMLAICPKHKGTEKVQLELKKKIAKLKKESSQTKGAKRKEDLFSFKKEGAGRVLVIGPANSGKTTIVNLLAGTNFKSADFPFTTSLPQSAMMEFENIKVQLIDTPPVSEDFFPGWLKNLIESSDFLIVVLDGNDCQLSSQIDFFEKLLSKFQNNRFLFLINKLKKGITRSDLESKKTFVFYPEEKEKLKRIIFENLNIVRVYTKKPNQKPDLFSPFIFKKGAVLKDLLQEIRPDGVEKFKSAKLFTKDSKKPLVVGRDYQLKDEDILEINFSK